MLERGQAALITGVANDSVRPRPATSLSSRHTTTTASWQTWEPSAISSASRFRPFGYAVSHYEGGRRDPQFIRATRPRSLFFLSYHFNRTRKMVDRKRESQFRRLAHAQTLIQINPHFRSPPHTILRLANAQRKKVFLGLPPTQKTFFAWATVGTKQKKILGGVRGLTTITKKAKMETWRHNFIYLFKIMTEQEILILFLAGAVGALVADILEDGALTLPKIMDGKLILGSIGGMVVGATAGYLVDGSIITAFLSGYAGKSAIENLLIKTTTQKPPEEKTIEDTIRMIAKEEMVDPDLAVRVAKCESGLKKTVTNTNTDGSIDRGIFQINNKYHPEVTEEQANNVEFSTRFFCKAFKAGNLSWWDATKKCWYK